MATYLRSLVDEEVCVYHGRREQHMFIIIFITIKIYIGRLKGCDRATNVINNFGVHMNEYIRKQKAL